VYGFFLEVTYPANSPSWTSAYYFNIQWWVEIKELFIPCDSSKNISWRGVSFSSTKIRIWTVEPKIFTKQSISKYVSAWRMRKYKTSTFWDITPCIPLKVKWRFESKNKPRKKPSKASSKLSQMCSLKAWSLQPCYCPVAVSTLLLSLFRYPMRMNTVGNDSHGHQCFLWGSYQVFKNLETPWP
jgi:hypothetical protein